MTVIHGEAGFGPINNIGVVITHVETLRRHEAGKFESEAGPGDALPLIETRFNGGDFRLAIRRGVCIRSDEIADRFGGRIDHVGMSCAGIDIPTQGISGDLVVNKGSARNGRDRENQNAEPDERRTRQGEQNLAQERSLVKYDFTSCVDGGVKWTGNLFEG